MLTLGVLRNFGGHAANAYLESFHNTCLFHYDAGEVSQPTVLTLVSMNLNDVFSRHLMLLTTNSIAWAVLARYACPHTHIHCGLFVLQLFSPLLLNFAFLSAHSLRVPTN